jgi:hypothetical protein
MAEERSPRDPRTELAQDNLVALLQPRAVRPVVDLGFGDGYCLEIGQPETPVDLLTLIPQFHVTPIWRFGRGVQ